MEMKDEVGNINARLKQTGMAQVVVSHLFEDDTIFLIKS